jgi:hypothetical protein
LSAFRHGLQCIQDKVEQSLLDLLSPSGDFNIFSKNDLDFDTIAERLLSGKLKEFLNCFIW